MSGLNLRLVVGLGNPGREYARTRHNAGWWYADAAAARFAPQASWHRDQRQHVETLKARVAGVELWLAKPLSYMNLSGGPVAALAHFHRITPGEMLVVHDDIDLEPGVARLKHGGGHGGHNGLRDIMAHLGADFWRLRLGVGHPGDKHKVIEAVLDRPAAAEQQRIDEALQRALDALPEMLSSGVQRATHALHSGNPRTAAP